MLERLDPWLPAGLTGPQAMSFVIIAGVVGLMVWDRLRYDLVALLALAAAVAVGLVPSSEAFRGFGDDIVIIVGAALVVSGAIGQSGVIERVVRPLAGRVRTVRGQLMLLVATVTVLSAFMKNIAALAIFLPVALQMARRAEISPSLLLMPMSFGALLGGVSTLIGTSPNIVVAGMRQTLLGQPFSMFDFTPVGAGIALAGVTFLAFGSFLLLPGGRKPLGGYDSPFRIEDYVTEARFTEASPFVDKPVADLEALAEGDVTVAAVIRGAHQQRYVPEPHWWLYADDKLILQGDPAALNELVDRARLELVGRKELGGRNEEIGVVEAVIMAGSAFIGETAQKTRLRSRHAVNLLAVSRAGRRLTTRLRNLTLQAGDVLVLQARLADMPEKLRALGCLPLAERNLQLGQQRSTWLPVAVVAATLVLVSLQLVPVAVGFFSAAVLVVVLGSLSLREAYGAIDWPILIMLGALIPVSEAVDRTGGSQLIGQALSHLAAQVPDAVAVAMAMIAAMLVTPFLNNAATVLVMAPVAVELAAALGLQPDPFLMAVAVGAGCDFLTPIGHQCNTLVMGPGGYKFGDYWRLGLPLTAIVIVVGVPLILLFWPLR